ncbi:MAG TPA: hypothetical protein GX392_02525 [Clostridiales bacterium]|nr:hypothetical protein [Clostridiales bacterium]
MVLLHIRRKINFKILLILTFLLLIPVAISYYFTNVNYNNWIDVYESGVSDVNLESLESMISGYNGLSYFFDFIFSSDTILIFCLLFSLVVCLFIGSVIVNDLSDGNGNLIISRISFKKYLRDNIVAQIIFNFAYLFTFFTGLFLLSYFLYGDLGLEGGISTNYGLMIQGESLLSYIGITAIQVLNLSIIITLITILSSLIIVFIKNKYIVQMFPLLYYFITLILGSTIGNINNLLANIFTVFILDVQIHVIVEEYLTRETTGTFFNSIVFIVTLSVINMVLYRMNINTYGKDYIL